MRNMNVGDGTSRQGDFECCLEINSKRLSSRNPYPSLSFFLFYSCPAISRWISGNGYICTKLRTFLPLSSTITLKARVRRTKDGVIIFRYFELEDNGVNKTGRKRETRTDSRIRRLRENHSDKQTDRQSLRQLVNFVPFYDSARDREHM